MLSVIMPSVVMLNVIMLSVIMLNVGTLSVVMLNVGTLSVVMPFLVSKIIEDATEKVSQLLVSAN